MLLEDIGLPVYDKVKRRLTRIIFSHWDVVYSMNNRIDIDYNGLRISIDLSKDLPQVWCDEENHDNACMYIKQTIINEM